jgi:hypothetical protein
MKIQFFKPALATMGILAAFGTAAFGSTVVVDRIDQPLFDNDTGGLIYGGEPTYFDTSDGGEFTDIVSDPTVLGSYAATNKVADPNEGGAVGFESFCLEINTSFPLPPGIPTNPLNYAISTNILNGGLTVVATPTQAAGSTEVVTLGTAWLYSQFANGTLTGYNFANPNAAFGSSTSPRGDSAAALQAAIWYLEGQVTFANAGGAGNQFLNLLTTSTGSGGEGLANINAAFAPDAGGFNVDVFNIGAIGGSTYPYQAMLVLVAPSTSVPDGGTTVMLLGIAFGGLALLKRKIAA